MLLEGTRKSPHPSLLLELIAGLFPLPSPVNSKCKPRGSLTNQETTEVEVGLIQIDERVRGFAYQQERDCDVVFGD